MTMQQTNIPAVMSIISEAIPITTDVVNTVGGSFVVGSTVGTVLVVSLLVELSNNYIN